MREKKVTSVPVPGFPQCMVLAARKQKWQLLPMKVMGGVGLIANPQLPFTCRREDRWWV